VSPHECRVGFLEIDDVDPLPCLFRFWRDEYGSYNRVPILIPRNMLKNKMELTVDDGQGVIVL